MEEILQNYKKLLLDSGKPVSSVANLVSHVRAFLRSKNVTDTSKVTKQMVTEYFAEKQPNCTVEKFNLMIWSLKNFFRFCKIDGLEFPRQKHAVKKVKGTISEHELINVLEPRLQHLFEDYWKVRAILYFLFYTGIHSSELSYIRKRNFSLSTNELIYTIPKKGIVRRVPLPEPLMKVLRKYFIVAADEKNVFNIGEGDINRIFRTLQRNEVLGKGRAIKPNFLKDSFTRHCAEKGVDLFIINQLLGHKDIKTTLGNLRMMSGDIKTIFLKKVNGVKKINN